jgi:putative transposase
MRRRPKAHRTVVYLCTSHVVWGPTYRRPVLTGDVRQRLTEILQDVAREQRAR